MDHLSDLLRHLSLSQVPGGREEWERFRDGAAYKWLRNWVMASLEESVHLMEESQSVEELRGFREGRKVLKNLLLQLDSVVQYKTTDAPTNQQEETEDGPPEPADRSDPYANAFGQLGQFTPGAPFV